MDGFKFSHNVAIFMFFTVFRWIFYFYFLILQCISVRTLRALWSISQNVLGDQLLVLFIQPISFLSGHSNDFFHSLMDIICNLKLIAPQVEMHASIFLADSDVA